ncbi:MAG: hypothetical protein E7269_01800 [Lachnospiraceae bacterium]|nr:hypothetical protein [Lachnospiraceae bacterium]
MINLLIYYVTHSLKNSIKRTWKVWLIVFSIFLFFIGVGIFAGSKAKDSTVIGENDSSTVTMESVEDYMEEDEMTEADVREMMVCIESAVLIILFAIVLFGINAGQKNGADIFTMADVNFLFPAPMKPQTLLLYKTILQMGLVLLGSCYILFQIPNLATNLNLSPGSIICLVTAYGIILVMLQLIRICSYTYFATHARYRKYVSFFTKLPLLVLVIVIGLAFLAFDKDIFRTMELLFANTVTDFIPFIGFTKAMIMHGIEGNYSFCLLFTLLSVVTLGLLIWFIWHLKADFYEDSLVGAEKKSELLAQAESGKIAANTKKKKRTASKKGNFHKGYGASIFFFKSLHTRKQYAKFGIFSKTCVTYLLVAISVGFFLRFVVDTSNIVLFGIIMVVFVYFRSYGNPISDEMALPYIYMVPENAYRKVAFTFLAGTVHTLIDLLPAYVTYCLLTGSSLLESLSWCLLALSIDFSASAWEMTLSMVLPRKFPALIRSILEFFLKFMAFLPCILFGLLVGLFTNVSTAILCISLLNVLIGTGVGAIAPPFFHIAKE